VNLFLERSCDQGCAFCYAREWLEDQLPARASLAELQPLFEHYASLVAHAGPPPPWDGEGGEAAMLRRVAGTVTLLGGEPTAHPEFPEVVRTLRGLGLGVCLFTAGSHPERVRVVADQLWFVTLNGRFVRRAQALGIDPSRLSAHLALRPGDDVVALLTGVANEGVSSVVLAFAAPAGGADGPFFTPDDLPAMAEVYSQASQSAKALGITLGWDCSFPSCLDPGRFPARCLPAPVLDPRGLVSVCGGAYFLESAARPLLDFDSLAGLHAFTMDLYARLRRRPTPFAACADCAELPQACHGGCLALRRGYGEAARPG